MKVHQKVPKLTVARGTDASLGAGVRLEIPEDRILTAFISDTALPVLQIKDQGGTYRNCETPAGDTYDVRAVLGSVGFAIACDGNVGIRNGTAGAVTIAYYYWEFA